MKARAVGFKVNTGLFVRSVQVDYLSEGWTTSFMSIKSQQWVLSLMVKTLPRPTMGGYERPGLKKGSIQLVSKIAKLPICQYMLS